MKKNYPFLSKGTFQKPRVGHHLAKHSPKAKQTAGLFRGLGAP